MDKKIKIKDDEVNKLWYIDCKVDGKRIRTNSRYTKQSKEIALTKIQKVKQEKIKEFTLYFDWDTNLYLHYKD